MKLFFYFLFFLYVSRYYTFFVSTDKMAGYRSLVDIIVTTPGRLVDHLKATEGFSLHNLRYLVIDEADRVMEGVQNDWLYHVNTHIGLHTGQYLLNLGFRLSLVSINVAYLKFLLRVGTDLCIFFFFFFLGTSKSFQVPPLCLKTLTLEKRPPQKLLFSATLSQDPEKLQQLGLFQPKLFTSVVKSDDSTESMYDLYVLFMN